MVFPYPWDSPGQIIAHSKKFECYCTQYTCQVWGDLWQWWWRVG